MSSSHTKVTNGSFSE
jgi:hypothetical protein